MIPNYAIIPTSDRPEVALTCIESVRTQVDVIYVIDNGETEKLPDSTAYSLIPFDRKGQTVNLSMLWNMGLTQAMLHATIIKQVDQWDVAILNDDTIIPDGWFKAVSSAMRGNAVAAACSGPTGRVHREPGPVPLHTRMRGWAFMLAGEKGIRANEELHWWYGDDDLDWKSRQAGGMIMIPGYPVQHLSPNGLMTPELQVQAGQDARVFLDYWKKMPW